MAELSEPQCRIQQRPAGLPEADSIAPSELRRAVFPLESMGLFGEAAWDISELKLNEEALIFFTLCGLEAFSADRTDREFEELCSSCERSKDLLIGKVFSCQISLAGRAPYLRRCAEGAAPGVEASGGDIDHSVGLPFLLCLWRTSGVHLNSAMPSGGSSLPV